LLLFTQFLKVNINATNENGHIYGALEVVKLALEIGIYNVDYPKQVFHNKYEEHPLQIFERVIKKVLDYFKLEYNQDETDLVPVTRKRFSR
jgi:RIO-like serine/threonine protein kinase